MIYALKYNYTNHKLLKVGLKNTFSHIYEKVMHKYTVNSPQYDADEDSELIFEKIFGSKDEWKKESIWSNPRKIRSSNGGDCLLGKLLS